MDLGLGCNDEGAYPSHDLSRSVSCPCNFPTSSDNPSVPWCTGKIGIEMSRPNTDKGLGRRIGDMG